MMFPFCLWRGGQSRPQDRVQVPSSQRHRGHFSEMCFAGGGAGGAVSGHRAKQKAPHALLTPRGSFSPHLTPTPTGSPGAGCRADSLYPLSRAEHSQVSSLMKCGWPTKQVVLGLKDGSGKGPDNVLGFPDHVWLQEKRCACACVRVCRGFCQPCQTGPWDLKSWTHLQPCLLPYPCYKPKQERELDRLCFDRAERKSS